MEKEAPVVQCTCGRKMSLARSDHAVVLGVVEPCATCSAIALKELQVRCSLCHTKLGEQELPPEVVRTARTGMLRVTPCRQCAGNTAKQALSTMASLIVDQCVHDHGSHCGCDLCAKTGKLCELLRSPDFGKADSCYVLACGADRVAECTRCHRPFCGVHGRRTKTDKTPYCDDCVRSIQAAGADKTSS